jgi:hypothetical protein
MTALRLQHLLWTMPLWLTAIQLSAWQIPAPSVPVTQQGPPKPPVPLASARAQDSYAIYSLLLNEHPFDALPTGQTSQLAIADTTVSIQEMNPAVLPETALQPPEDNVNAFKEALQDFRNRRFERVQLTRRFSLGEDYILLNSSQVDDFRNARAGTSPGSDLQDEYAGYPGITFFTEPYFNSTRTAALVYRNNWCANPCSNGQWFYLEKRGSAWVRRSGSPPHA